MSDPRNVGFDRLKTEPLPGTVKLYQRHLFICTGRSDWPPRIEVGGGFPQALSEALSPQLSEMSLNVKVTACDQPSKGPGQDILVFPDGVRYQGVQEADLIALVDDHLVGNRVSNRIPHERLKGQHIFVCVHGARDPRCGACGPPLIEHFTAAVRERGLAETVTVQGSSHVGGHRFAGNVLIYPGGDWYGYVTPEDVPRIVDRHIMNGEILVDLWRGRLGLTPEEQQEQIDVWHGG
jgi:(2Fe-2S) ferredoxin